MPAGLSSPLGTRQPLRSTAGLRAKLCLQLFTQGMLWMPDSEQSLWSLATKCSSYQEEEQAHPPHIWKGIQQLSLDHSESDIFPRCAALCSTEVLRAQLPWSGQSRARLRDVLLCGRAAGGKQSCWSERNIGEHASPRPAVQQRCSWVLSLGWEQQLPKSLPHALCACKAAFPFLVPFPFLFLSKLQLRCMEIF